MVKRNPRWDEVPRQNTTIDRLIKTFEIRNRTLNRSPKTVSWYSSNLGMFHRFLQARGYPLELERITINEVREFIVHLQNRNKYEEHPLTPTKAERLSPQTVRGYVQSLKAFFSWLYKEGYADYDRLEKLEFPKVPRKFVEVLNDQEVRQILSKLNLNTALGTRNAAIVTTLLDTGLRCAEMAGLTLGDSHIEEGYLKVMGKGAKERVVPIGASVQKVLLRYGYYFRPEPARPDIRSLFLTIYGEPMTVNSVEQMIRRLGEASGVPRLHAHLCRHTFATNYLINGGDVFTLQQILGHTTLEMVRRYVTLSSEFVIGQHSRFSPLDTMHPKVNRRPRRRLSSRSS